MSLSPNDTEPSQRANLQHLPSYRVSPKLRAPPEDPRSWPRPCTDTSGPPMTSASKCVPRCQGSSSLAATFPRENEDAKRLNGQPSRVELKSRVVSLLLGGFHDLLHVPHGHWVTDEFRRNVFGIPLEVDSPPTRHRLRTRGPTSDTPTLHFPQRPADRPAQLASFQTSENTLQISPPFESVVLRSFAPNWLHTCRCHQDSRAKKLAKSAAMRPLAPLQPPHLQRSWRRRGSRRNKNTC